MKNGNYVLLEVENKGILATKTVPIKQSLENVLKDNSEYLEMLNVFLAETVNFDYEEIDFVYNLSLSLSPNFEDEFTEVYTEEMVEDTYLDEDSILDLFFEYIYGHKVIESRVYFLEVNEGKNSYHQLFEEQPDTSPNAVNEGLDIVNDEPY